jgi:hypothetical protein
MVRAGLVGVVLVAACASSLTLDQAMTGIAPSSPAVPQTSTDSLLAEALRQAALEWHMRGHVIIQQSGILSPHALPVVDSVSFYLLEPVRIQQLAIRHDVPFLDLSIQPKAFVDSAEVGVSNTWLYRKTTNLGTRVGGGGCIWQFRKNAGRWRRSRVVSCVDS